MVTEMVPGGNISPTEYFLKPIKDMITITKHIVALLAVIALVGFAGAGCNTAHGFGKDVSNVGKDIQNSAK